MASLMIHIAVASELNKRLNKNESKLLIGTIAPDISKLLNQNKVKSHFLDNEDTNIPNLEKFLLKYKSNLNDDFVLGYYIHLYTDYLWFKYFITEIYDKNAIKKLSGEVVKCNERMNLMYIYNDYTNLNIQLIDEYNLNLKIFYNEIPKIPNIIQEIPMDKLDLIVNKTSIIIQNSKKKKDMVFNLNNIKKFIELSVEIIYSNIEGMKICER